MVARKWKWDVFIVVFLLMVFVGELGFAADAPVPQSGQTTSYGSRDDGALKKGTPLPTPRFSDLGDGTVFDVLTNLVWMKNANCWGYMGWASAIAKINDLNNGQTTCSSYSGHNTDWRLPSLNELESLIDYVRSNVVLPSGHPFTGVQTGHYWSSTTYAGYTSNAWVVDLSDGDVNLNDKTYNLYVWPVRGGQ